MAGIWTLFNRRRFIICILLILCVLFTHLVALAQSDPASEVIQLVNALRVSYGVPAYQIDNVLMNVAQAQASWSAANNHIGHDGPGGTSPNDRAQAAGYGGGLKSFAIENAAHGTASLNTPQLVVRMWQGDWGHLNAMISPDYQHIGVGYAEANGYSWYVMMVGWVADGPAPNPTQEVAVAEPASIPFVLSQTDENGAIYHEVQAGQSAWTIARTEMRALRHSAEASITLSRGLRNAGRSSTDSRLDCRQGRFSWRSSKAGTIVIMHTTMLTRRTVIEMVRSSPSDEMRNSAKDETIKTPDPVPV